MWVRLTRPFCPGCRPVARSPDEDVHHRRSRGRGSRDDRPGGPPRRPPFLPPSSIGRHTASGTGTPLGVRPPRRLHDRVTGADLGGHRLGAGPLDDAGHHPLLVRQGEHDDRALLTGARGTAGAVQVVLVVGRRVDVQDQADVVDVDAAGGDVGRDEHVHEPSLKSPSTRVRAPCVMPPCSAAANTPRSRSCSAMRSAPSWVRTKMIVRPSRAAISAVTGALSCGFDEQHVVAHRGDRRLGLVGRVGDRVGQVALDQGVDVVVQGGREQQPLAARPGIWSRSAVTSGRKPMSAMWSASSSTAIWTSPSSTAPRSIRSRSRPGVATRMSTPRSSALICVLVGQAAGDQLGRRPRTCRAARARRSPAWRAHGSAPG